MRPKASLAIVGLGLAAALLASGAPIYIAQGVSAPAVAANIGSSLSDDANARGSVARLEHLHTRGQLPDLVEGAAKTLNGAMRPTFSAATPSIYSDMLVFNPATGSMEILARKAPVDPLAPTQTLRFNPTSGSVKPVRADKKEKTVFKNMHPQDPSIRYTPRILDNVHFQIPDKIKGKRRRLDALELSAQQEAELTWLEKMEYKVKRSDAFKHVLLQHEGLEAAPGESSRKRKEGTMSLPRSEHPLVKTLHSTSTEAHNVDEVQGAFHATPEINHHRPLTQVSRTVEAGKGNAAMSVSPDERVSPSKPGEHSGGSAASASGSSTAQLLPHQASPARQSTHALFTEPTSSDTHEAAQTQTGLPPAASPGVGAQYTIHEPPSRPAPSSPKLPWFDLNYPLYSHSP